VVRTVPPFDRGRFKISFIIKKILVSIRDECFRRIWASTQQIAADFWIYACARFPEHGQRDHIYLGIRWMIYSLRPRRVGLGSEDEKEGFLRRLQFCRNRLPEH
jgi:hypothetical protein